MQNFYILLASLLITIALLIADIYCYLIKYQTRQKHSLKFHVTYDKLKLKEIMY